MGELLFDKGAERGRGCISGIVSILLLETN